MTSIWFLQKGGSPEKSKSMDAWIFCGSISPLYLDQYVGSIPIKHTKMYEPCWEKMPREYYSAQRRKGLHVLHRVRESIVCLCFIALNSSTHIFGYDIGFFGFFFSLDSYICLFCSSFLLKKQNDFNKIKTLSPSSKKQNKTKKPNLRQTI